MNANIVAGCENRITNKPQILTAFRGKLVRGKTTSAHVDKIERQRRLRISLMVSGDFRRS
jgi:hypothetical protein